MKQVVFSVMLIMFMAMPAWSAVSSEQYQNALKAYNDGASTAETDDLLADPTIEDRYYIDLMMRVKVKDAISKRDMAAIQRYITEVNDHHVDILYRALFFRTVSNELWKIGDHDASLNLIEESLNDPDLEPQSSAHYDGLIFKSTCLRKLKRYEEAIATAQIVISLIANDPTEENAKHALQANANIMFTADLQGDTDTVVDAANNVLQIVKENKKYRTFGAAYIRKAFQCLTDIYIKTENNDAMISLMAKYLDVLDVPSELHAKLFGTSLPGNSTLLLWALDAQTVLENYKTYMRVTEGRINTSMMASVVEQLNTGGDFRPFSMGTTEASILAKLDPNADTYPYTSAMLEGRFEDAIRVAHGFATNPDATDKEYAQWMQAASAAIRCLDQTYNGRAVEFLRWANGETTEDGSPVVNPVADILDL